MKDADHVTEELVATTLRRAISYHSILQADDGHWPGDFGGPTFLVSGVVTKHSCLLLLNRLDVLFDYNLVSLFLEGFFDK